VIERFADVALSGGLAELTEALQKWMSDPQKVKEFEKAFAEFGGALATVVKTIAQLIEGWSSLTETVADWWQGYSEEGLMEKRRRKEMYASLPDELRKRVDRGADLVVTYQAHKTREAYQNHVSVQNNITIHQDTEGRVTRVTSDNIDTENNVAASRGAFNPVR
jgi:putative protein kinase ArgK-like GTPase of G3E family